MSAMSFLEVRIVGERRGSGFDVSARTRLARQLVGGAGGQPHIPVLAVGVVVRS